MALLTFVSGLVLLVVGAEALVRGASRGAAALGVSPLVVGLTVVAFGTSAPEMAVSTRGALAGDADIALGNVIGSNVFNVLFILGLSALVAPLRVAAEVVRRDVPLMILVSVALPVVALGGGVSRLEGTMLLGSLLLYTAWLVRAGRRSPALSDTPSLQPSGAVAKGEGADRGLRFWLLQLVLVVGGLGMLVGGSRWLVEGAVSMARVLGVSELLIGLTVVAAGTSLPELATSVVASLRGERDIAVGNVVGSNIFNLLGVLGLAAAVAPEGVPVSAAVLRFDVPVMVAAAIACLPVFFTEHRIARWEGGLFLAYYLLYVGWLVLAASDHAFLPPFRAALLFFVVPLTAATLTVLTVRAQRRGNPAPIREQ